MLSSMNEIQEYKWEEGSLYRPAADSGSEVKTKEEKLPTRIQSATKRSVKNATSESNDPVLLMKS
jgi:hypothetical protein